MSEQKTAGKARGIYIIFLLFLPAILLIVISRGCNMKFKTLDDFGAINNYSFEGYDGKRYSQNDFKDKVVIFINMQEDCLDSCSISLFTFEKIIYQHIRPKKSLKDYKIVAFVNNYDGTPVESLQKAHDLLSDKIHHYDPSIWILAKGDAKQVYDIQHNGQNLLQTGDEYFGGNAFQELMLLVDKNNRLRMVLRGHQEGMFRRMKECIALLQKEYNVQSHEKDEEH
jgi:hypothetical protein